MSEPQPADPNAPQGFAQRSEAAGLPLPRVLGRRILLKLAARGGMGDVYLGTTTGIDGAERACIVKTVRRDHIHDGSFLARFLDEARVQAQLQHPGVAQVLEAATDDEGEPYTVVEYVEGRALSEVRQRALQTGARIAWPDAVAVAVEIAQALAHVHERAGADGSPLGIVHRDLSPQNVMVGYAGEVKLIDFGTARGQNRKCHTVAGVVFAKPGYVSPEIARQQVGDGRIDLYALGVMLWELCAGRRFLTGDPQRHLDATAEGRVVVPELAGECRAPRELDEAIAGLTKNDPDERFATAAIAARDLAKLLASAPADGGERGVRGRIASLMRKLWPHEPGRSRAEFARLLRDARATLEESGVKGSTPSAGLVSEALAARMAPSDPAQLAGTPYRLGAKIGEGASGVVYEAEHIELQRKVALKILGREHAASPEALERFRTEARAVAGLSHPNLVQLYDFGKSLDGRVFLAMDLCEGETLDARIRRGPMPWQAAARIAIEAARALEAAHTAGLVHRDLKPQNLMLVRPAGSAVAGEPRVKLLDFGLATALTLDPGRAADPRARAHHGFAIFGTPEYMAPEQVSGDRVDGRADVYALGCVLYEMLTGARAFEGTSSVVVMGKQLRETPLPPRVRAPAQPIPAGMDAVVVRAMAKDRDERFPSAAAMRAALESALAAPMRFRARLRSGASMALTGLAMLACGVASARWARSEVRALDAAENGAVAAASTQPAPPAASALALPIVSPAPPASTAPPAPVTLAPNDRAPAHERVGHKLRR
ncbi:MAG: serine/threonine-protein kinase [Polyangiaceae bacterium]